MVVRHKTGWRIAGAENSRPKNWKSISFVAWFCLLLLAPPSIAQSVIGSARVLRGTGNSWESSGPIVGAIINQSSTTITDLEIEMSIITRDPKGNLKRKRDIRLVVVPSLNQTGMVFKLEPNGDVYFSIPGKDRSLVNDWCIDCTCPGSGSGVAGLVSNVATLAITRINGRWLITDGKGRPLKQAPLESMLQVPAYTPQHVPTQREVIDGIRENNALLQSTIINRQLQDCLSRGTWACTFNRESNINVVITQQ